MQELIKLYNNDCVAVMQQDLEPNSIDLVVTSPPYDNLRTYNNSCIWNFEKFKSVAQNLKRILTNKGIIVWIVADATINGSETGTSFRQALYFMELGFKLHDTMIWQKSTSTYHHKNRYVNIFEYMFILSKTLIKNANLIKDRKNKWGGTFRHGTERKADGTLIPVQIKQKQRVIPPYGTRLNIWQINECKTNKTKHPAVFPLQLAEDHIKTWSNPRQTVLDPFMGSGTTGIACKNLGRNFIGIEIDKTYFEIAKQRINNARVD